MTDLLKDKKNIDEIAESATCFNNGEITHRQKIPFIHHNPVMYSKEYKYLCCDIRDCEYQKSENNVSYCIIDKIIKS